MTPNRQRRLISRCLCHGRAIAGCWPTLASGLVLAVIATVALMSGSFEPRTESAVRDSPGPSVTTPVTSLAIREPVTRPQRRTLVFLVGDRVQASALLQTYGTLTWERDSFDPYFNLRAPRVYCLVAGTPEEKTRAVRALNVMVIEAASQQVNMSVFDLRLREAPANGGKP